jgi:hypothetical protein
MRSSGGCRNKENNMNLPTIIGRIETGMATAADAQWLREHVVERLSWHEKMTACGWTEQSDGTWVHKSGVTLREDLVERWQAEHDTLPPF